MESIGRRKYKNIFWFLIDGLRPDFLHLKNSNKISKNFFEQLVSNATVFSNVVTTNAGTHTSMHSIFTSLLPSYNGATGWAKQALRNFNQEIFTIADYFQMAGYETFRYCDADGERTVPMSGFKRWESSGHKIGKVLYKTDLTKTERRNQFIEDVNMCLKSKFVYHHVELLHELNCSMGPIWNHEDYARNIDITAREFKKLYYEYSIGEDDLVIISSDHGVLLDFDFKQDGIENGERQYEDSVICFFSLIGKDIPSQVLPNYISALDIAPTLLHVSLGISMADAQGKDQFDYINEGIYEKEICYREKGSYNVIDEEQNSMGSDIYYIRGDNWKYVFGERDPRCEWLINLKKNPDYQINLKDVYPELTQKYYQLLKSMIDKAKTFQYESRLGFEKDSLKKFFSLVLQMDKIEKRTLDSLLDMGGPYYEIVVNKLDKNLSNYRKYYKIKEMEMLKTENMSDICTGEWIVSITQNGEWSEYFLSDLYRYIGYHRNQNVLIRGMGFDAIKKEDEPQNINIDLIVSDEIRSIECYESECDNKKCILFGCGKIGKEALTYLGNKKVYCFVDNNSELVGKSVCGKKVMSFNEFKKIAKKYKIIIATRSYFAFQIMEQLKKNEIYNYDFFENIKDRHY